MRPLKVCEIGSPFLKLRRLSSALTLLPSALTPWACKALARVIRCRSGLWVDQLLPRLRVLRVVKLQASLRSNVVAWAGAATDARTARISGERPPLPVRVELIVVIIELQLDYAARSKCPSRHRQTQAVHDKK
ncbi:hypothetical protein D3C79_699460 [compost metagenome]